MIDPEHPELSVVRQCGLVSINWSGFYYQPAGETSLELMRLVKRQFLETPWYGLARWPATCGARGIPLVASASGG